MADVQKALNDVLKSRPSRKLRGSVTVPGAPPPPLGPRRFTAFNLGDSMRAAALARFLADQAKSTFDSIRGGYDQQRETALLRVRDVVQNLLDAGQDEDYVKHALKLFVVHHGLAAGVAIDPLEQRHPHLVAPSVRVAVPIGPTPTGPVESDEQIAKDNGPEQALAWWREDPCLNEHHEHWHAVFPISGKPLDPGKPIDRQGEMFWYMHEQMLARYDTERLAAGMSPVVPWVDYEDVTSETCGYHPGNIFLANLWERRMPGQQWPFRDVVPGMLGTADLKAMQKWTDNLKQAAESGYFKLPESAPAKVTSDNFGATIEADVASVQPEITDLYMTNPPTAESTRQLRATTYGEMHNCGHDLFGLGPGGANINIQHHGGVMSNTVTACRDPIFWRWHRNIDLLHYQWEQIQLEPHDFSEHQPQGVTIERADIRLAFGDLAPVADLCRGGKAAFADPPTTNQLVTRFLTRSIAAEGGIGGQYGPDMEPTEITYLDQDPYTYILRLHISRRQQTAPVTVRMFLVRADQAENRRMWIEMDKFSVVVPNATSGELFITRPASLSSVIKKPGLKPPAAYQPKQKNPTDQQSVDQNYCDCGWPYNLLLPRGTTDGMHCKLLVLLTDRDRVVDEDCNCGSLSFCGAKNAKYPDALPMGYPFDAPFDAGDGILDTFDQLRQAAVRDLTIRFAGGPG